MLTLGVDIVLMYLVVAGMVRRVRLGRHVFWDGGEGRCPCLVQGAWWFGNRTGRLGDVVCRIASETYHCLIVGEACKEARIPARLVMELQQILEFTRALAVQKPLGMAGRLSLPFEHGLLPTWQMAIKLRVQVLPGIRQGGLMQ